MHKKVLTEVDLYTGEISMPKGFEIDRDKIRNDIIESFVKKIELTLIHKLMLLMIMLYLILNLYNGCKITLEIIGELNMVEL